MAWVHILSFCAIVSLAGGVAGLVTGWRVSQSSGPDALMHYPPPFVWMRGRLLSARWVMRLGAMYVLAGFTVGAMGLQSKGTNERADLDRPCQAIASRLTRADWSPARWTTRPIGDHRPGCSRQLIDDDGVRWFSIRSSPPRGMRGEEYRHQTVELERKAMALKPVNGIGERAMMATPRSKVVANPTLVIVDENGTHTVEMNARRVDPDRVVDILRTTASDSM